MAINCTTFPEETLDRHPTCNITTCKYSACSSKTKIAALCLFLHAVHNFATCWCHAMTTLLLFCDETAVQEQYILQTAPPCVKPKSLVTHKRHTKIYNPSKKLTKIKTYSCKIQRTNYTSTFYFFGTKQHETTATNDPSPSVELCQDWVTHKHSVTMGTFKQNTKNV